MTPWDWFCLVAAGTTVTVFGWHYPMATLFALAAAASVVAIDALLDRRGK